MKFLSPKREQGMTLVEIMVVVAIIGVLSALAVPNFKKYQARSKTPEAKLQLAAAYIALKAFQSDFDTYHACLKYMGYDPTSERTSRYYVIGLGSVTDCSASCDTVATTNGATMGVGACEAGVGKSLFPAGKKLGSTAALTTFTENVDVPAGLSADDFTLGAIGVIDEAFATQTTSSAFWINATKYINNSRNGY